LKKPKIEINKMEVDHQNQWTTNDLADMLTHQTNSQLNQNERLTFLYPAVDHTLVKVPSSLSASDKSSWIETQNFNPFQCKYTESPRTLYNRDDDVGSIRTSDPIPSECGIYYFEMCVLNDGEDGAISIGLTSKGTNLNHQPGWDRHTWGYHGDDGNFFEEDGGYGKKYGPVYGKDDVVGCGLNLRSRSCFFTKNGKFLGVAVRNLPVIEYYPTIGVHSKDECVEVNLGQKPFLYNIAMEKILYNAHQKDIARKIL